MYANMHEGHCQVAELHKDNSVTLLILQTSIKVVYFTFVLNVLPKTLTKQHFNLNNLFTKEFIRLHH